jgi:hypothetical protein
MKNTIINLIAVVALSISGAAFAADEMQNRQQPAATQPAPAASAVPATTVVGSKTTVPAEKPQPAAKPSTSGKRAKASAVRPKDLDLRHCLELDNNPAIARCARE